MFVWVRFGECEKLFTIRSKDTKSLRCSRSIEATVFILCAWTVHSIQISCRLFNNLPADGYSPFRYQDRRVAVLCSSIVPIHSTSSYLCAIGVSTAERAQRRCFCIDVTCDNLLDAVKQTVEEETMALIKRMDAELMTNLREYEVEEQSLAAEVATSEVATSEGLQDSTPSEAFTALESARRHKASTESKLSQLHQSMTKFKGLAHCEIDLIEPSSSALKNLAKNPRKRATTLLRAGSTYEAIRLDKTLPGPQTLLFSLSLTEPSTSPAHHTS